MIHVTTREAQARLPDLLNEAWAGATVEIAADNGGSFRLVPVSRVTGTPRAGSCKGLIEMTDDFDTSLDELGPYEER